MIRMANPAPFGTVPNGDSTRPAAKAGTVKYTDAEGLVRYRKSQGPKRYTSSLKPVLLSLAQIEGEKPINQKDWEKMFSALGLTEVPKAPEFREVVKNMSADNVNKGLRQGEKKRQSWKVPRKIDMVMRRAKALELKRAGYSYEEIAAVESLGYKNHSAVQRDLQMLYRQMLDEPSKDQMALELYRIESVVRFLWASVREGDLAAMDRLFHAMKIKHSMLGLNKPMQIEVNVSDHMDMEIARLTEELGALDANSVSHQMQELDGKFDQNWTDPDRQMPGTDTENVRSSTDPTKVGGARATVTQIKEKQARDRKAARRGMADE